MKATASREAVMKTPVELELEKLDLPKLMEQKNIEADYVLLRVLTEITRQHGEVVNSAVFQNVYQGFNSLINYHHLRYLPLYESFSYALWNNENYPFEVREQTSFYKIVSNWIVSFELRSGKLDSIAGQFALITNFLQKETHTALQRIVVIEETFEDLKDLIARPFWKEEEKITVSFSQSKSTLKKNALNYPEGEVSQEQSEEKYSLEDVEAVLELLAMVVVPQVAKFGNKDKHYEISTYSKTELKNYSEFVRRCIYFCLNARKNPSSIQTELTKLALVHLQSSKRSESGDIMNMLKHLMVRTTKAVRFALIMEYVEFYEYLEGTGYEEVIEELEGIIYFRELIIGRNIIEESIQEGGNSLNSADLPFHEDLIKAGASKRVYFSNEHDEDSVLKLDLTLKENDINLKIVAFDNFPMARAGPDVKINQFIFENVSRLNKIDGTSMGSYKQKMYWQEQRSTSKKLELRLQHRGLYALEFDNSYSWVQGKSIRYRLEVFRPLQIRQ